MNRKLAVRISAGVAGSMVLALVLNSVYERAGSSKMDAPKAVIPSHDQLISKYPCATLSIRGYTNVTCRGIVPFAVNLFPKSAKVTCVNLQVLEYPNVVMFSRPGPEKVFTPTRSDLLLAYDTCRLPNGNHTANVIMGDPASLTGGDWGDDYHAQDVPFRTENTISEFNANKDLVTARLSTFFASWRIDVLKGSGRSPEKLKFQLVRSFHGLGGYIRWRWDEKDSHGVRVKDRSATLGWLNKHVEGLASVYFYRITAMRGSKVLQQTEPASSNDFMR